jgi:hypothetical protein
MGDSKAMNSNDNQRMQVFFSHFTQDNNRFLVSKLPYYDDCNNRRIIDFGIVSQDPSVPRVAILIWPKNSEQSPQQLAEHDFALRLLQQQNWVPVIFNPDDISYRPRFVKETLDEIFTGKKRPTKKKKRKSGFGWLSSFCTQHAGVWGFAMAMLLLMAVCFSIALEHSSRKFHFTQHYKPRTVDAEIAQTKTSRLSHKYSRSTRFLSADSNTSGSVIDLDEQLTQEVTSPVRKGKKLPIYVATVQYCDSGMGCVLKNDIAIQLWGVKLPDSAEKRVESAEAINAMIAGQQVVFEKQRVIGKTLLVKAKLGKTDIALSQVRKGLLVPNEEGAAYATAISRQYSRTLQNYLASN